MMFHKNRSNFFEESLKRLQAQYCKKKDKGSELKELVFKNEEDDTARQMENTLDEL